MPTVDWNHVITGVITGVIAALLTGLVPFLVQLRWRREDVAFRHKQSRTGDAVAAVHITTRLRTVMGHIQTGLDLAESPETVAGYVQAYELEFRHAVNEVAAGLPAAVAIRLRELAQAFLRAAEQRHEPEQARQRWAELASWLQRP